MTAPEDLPGGPAEPNNDDDQDFLVDQIAIAPTTIFLDSAVSRQVCNPGVGNVNRTHSGDATADAFGGIAFALEKDAYQFSDAND